MPGIPGILSSPSDCAISGGVSGMKQLRRSRQAASLHESIGSGQAVRWPDVDVDLSIASTTLATSHYGWIGLTP